jgi:protein TonB
MRVRALLIVAVVLAIGSVGSVGAMGQSGAASSGSGQAPDAANNAPPGSKDRPARVSGGVMAGLILHRVDPVYPEDAKQAGVSGAIILAATIDDAGKISKLSVVSGPEKLRDAALDAVNQWTYKPYLLNGRPVYVQTVITVNFNIAN